MPKRIFTVTVWLVALTLQSLPAAEFFVATNGSDGNPGSREKPFATPARAVAAVRSLIAGGLQEDVRVIFRAGTYALAAPLVFSAADSGTAEHSITYTTNPGERVVISGGRPITNWKLAEGRTWTADLAEVKAGRWFFRQLVINDRRAVRARWPNEDGVLHLATRGRWRQVVHL